MRRRRELSSQLRRVTAAHVQPGIPDTLLIRYSRDGDAPALERLAALDSQRLREGPFLLAEIDGELVAATPLHGEDEPVSDPFRPTAAVRELLSVRRRQVQRTLGAAPRDAAARFGPAQRSVSSF